MTKRIGKIDPLLKVRIDKKQHQIDFIDDLCNLNEKYPRSYLALREALVERKITLVEMV